MRNFCIILVFLIFNISSFAQWKSYYPDVNSSNKANDKFDSEKNKKIFDNHLFNALRAKSLENYDEALNNFQKCIDIDSNNPLPFYESAIINAKNGRYSIALEQIRTAEGLSSDNRRYSLMHAEILFDNQDFINAAIQYTKLIKLEPGNKDLYFKLSDAYIYANDLKKAIGVYDDLQEYNGVDKMLSMQKHKLYRELNDIKGAINELSTILIRYPNDIKVIEILSELYLLNDEKDKAFELFKKLAIIAPNNGRIHLTLADYYRDNGENSKSYSELKLAFKSSELNIDTKVRILVSYYQLISLNEQMAIQSYELAEILLETHPEDLKSRAVFADILYSDNKYQEAKEQYLMVLKNDKSKSQLWTQVLFIQAEQNNFDEMLQTSNEALEYFPTEALFYYFNGTANKQFKSYESAIYSLQMGIEFVVDNENLLLELYSSLADIYHTTNQHKLSDEYYEKSLAIDPNNLLVLNNYAYYLSVRKKNLQYAKQISLRCNKLELDNGTYQDTYAWILFMLEEYELAKEWILKSLLNGGANSPVVVEHYGDILYKLGQLDESVEQWKKAKEMGGDTDFLLQKIEEGKLYE